MEALGEAARRACHVQGEDTSPLARQELVSVRLKTQIITPVLQEIHLGGKKKQKQKTKTKGKQ